MTAESLQWNAPPANMNRFREPAQAPFSYDYRNKGYTDGFMFAPKIPQRQAQSADIHNADVNRFFSKDASDNYNSPRQAPRQEPPAWLQNGRDKELGPQPTGRISPHPQDSFRQREPVIRDPFNELTPEQRQKKVEETYRAQQDLAEAKMRKQEQERERLEEQKKIREMQEDYNPYGQPGGGAPTDNNRKMKFTEQQLERRGSPKYGDTQPFDPVDRHHPSPRLADMVRENEQEINELKHDLDTLKTQRDHKSYTDRKSDDILEHQSEQIRRLERELQLLKSNDRGYSPDYRAQSEPLTDRNMRRRRDQDFWGNSDPNWLNATPRRKPVGKLYEKNSIYKQDFNQPDQRHGPNKISRHTFDVLEPYDPFGQGGAGAPLRNQAGFRNTKIQGNMKNLGRERSDSAKANLLERQNLGQAYERQLMEEKEKREMERRQLNAPSMDFASKMRGFEVGNPVRDRNGMLKNSHLPHIVSAADQQRAEPDKKLQYHRDLDEQIQAREALNRLGALKDKNEAIQHFYNFDGYFGRRGGGNYNNPADQRKGNLLKRIHHSQETFASNLRK